jgi:hypothetical protein
VQLLLLLKCAKVTITVAFLTEIPGSPAEDSLLSALDAKVVAFPPAHVLPKPSPSTSPSLGVLQMVPQEEGEESFRGGSLRGLFWALLLES